jgi:hypothetical protein
VIRLALLVAAALAVGLDAPWWARGLLVPPALLWVPGWGLAARLDPDQDSRLQRLLDGAWIGMALAWAGVAIAREAGLGDGAFGAFLFAWAGAWTAAGARLGRGRSTNLRAPRGALLGAAGVVLGVLGIAAWRAEDVARPLADHWWHEGATELGSPGGEPLAVLPATGWDAAERVGWEEAGAWSLAPGDGQRTLSAPEGAEGRIVVAVQGPLGTRVRVGDAEAVVQASPLEHPDEGPVRRYEDRGTVGLTVPVDLTPGEPLVVETDAERAWLLTGPDAVWALHAEGGLRYVHYYQLLNQVENLDWAREVREDRWFTWNQPPGWSPLLSIGTLLISPDLPGCNALFLWVIALVGLSAVRLAVVVAPGAPAFAWAVPGGMAAAHGLLMLEPASANFPDSLYAAAVLGVAAAVAAGRDRALGGMGVWAQALRWPGAVLSSLLALSFAVFARARPWRGLGLLWAGVALGGLVALAAAATGHAEDLLFILYFETFPEHWHGEYAPPTLLGRVPGFYLNWLTYTGGGLLVAVAGAIGARNPPRLALRALLAAALAYSALLCTIDHHPTHYFLPLVGLTGPMVVAAAAATRPRLLRSALPVLVLAGLWAFLWRNQV